MLLPEKGVPIKRMLHSWRSRTDYFLSGAWSDICWSVRSKMKIGHAKEWNDDFVLEGSRKEFSSIYWRKA